MKEQTNLNDLSGISKIFAATVLYGLGNTVTKSIYRFYPQIAPEDLSCMRFIVAALLLTLVCAKAYRDKLHVQRKDIPLFILMGFGISFCVYSILLAMNYISVGAASFTQSTNTLFLCLFSVVVLKERLSSRKLIGLVIGFAGLTVMFCGPDIFSNGGLAAVGYGAALLSAVGKSTYILSAKKIRQNYEALPTVMYCTVIASFLMLTVGRPWRIYMRYGHELQLHFLILLMGMICAGLAYILYFSGIKTVEASTVGIINTVEPVSSVITALLILGELLTWRQCIGCLMILVGLVITQLKQSK